MAESVNDNVPRDMALAEYNHKYSKRNQLYTLKQAYYRYEITPDEYDRQLRKIRGY